METIILNGETSIEDWMKLAEAAFNDDDDAAAVEYWRKAAEAGNIEAAYAIGAHYFYDDEAVSADEAEKWLRVAADGGHDEAAFSLAEFYEAKEDLEAAAAAYKKALDCKDEEIVVNAAFCLGELYNAGEGIARDKRQAIDYYSLAAEHGDGEALARIGRIYMERDSDAPPDYEKARDYLSRAAAENEHSAWFYLGLLDMFDNDGAAAINKFLKAAAFYRPFEAMMAEFFLGKIYDDGIGVKPSQKKALKHYEAAAERGYSKAMLCAGMVYIVNARGDEKKGKGGRKLNVGDLKKAQRHFQNALDAGDEDAYFCLAATYVVMKSIDKAIAYFDKAVDSPAATNRAQALYQLGRIFAAGLGGQKQDIDKAVEYFRRAADEGDGMSLMELGNIYAFGERSNALGAQQIARQYFQRAAELGAEDADDAVYMLDAMNDPNLGEIRDFLKGRGNAQNFLTKDLFSRLT